MSKCSVRCKLIELWLLLIKKKNRIISSSCLVMLLFSSYNYNLRSGGIKPPYVEFVMLEK